MLLLSQISVTLRAPWGCACPCLPLDRRLSRSWCPPHQTLFLCVGHSGHFLKCTRDHSSLGICPPSAPELPRWSAHPQVTRRGPGHEKPQDKQINKSSFPRQRCYSGGNVCDNKPDTEGTECKMCMNFEIKPGTPAGSAAASGCTPHTPLRVTGSPSSALRETSRERWEDTCLQQEGPVLMSESHRRSPGCIPACLLTDLTWTGNHSQPLPDFPFPHPAPCGLPWPAGRGLYFDPVSSPAGTSASHTGKKPSGYFYKGHSPTSPRGTPTSVPTGRCQEGPPATHTHTPLMSQPC